jgi:protein SCO1/2
MKYLYIVILPLLVFSACKENKKVSTSLPSDSIFNLTSAWQNQHGESLQLKNLQHKTLVVVMIYTSCKTACPILVSKMKKIESGISRKDINEVSLVLISIDPKTDTPERLNEFARNNAMDAEQWTFLTSSEEATEEFANVLSMKYKKISPLEFSHSNIISVFSPDGQLVRQEEGNIDVEKVVSTVTQTVKANS